MKTETLKRETWSLTGLWIIIKGQPPHSPHLRCVIKINYITPLVSTEKVSWQMKRCFRRRRMFLLVPGPVGASLIFTNEIKIRLLRDFKGLFSIRAWNTLRGRVGYIKSTWKCLLEWSAVGPQQGEQHGWEKIKCYLPVPVRHTLEYLLMWYFEDTYFIEYTVPWVCLTILILCFKSS